jgi:predicted metalloprotease
MPDPAKPYRSEQFADFYAGWYAGQRKKLEQSYPASVFATMLSSLTSETRSTHGTTTDRILAVVEGFKSAEERKLTFLEAIEAGEKFARAQPES